MTTFLSALYDYNICTYYLLPLIKHNRRSFGPKNFKQCYLNSEGDKLFVLVSYMPEAIEYDDNFLISQKYEDQLFLIFSVPCVWTKDVKHFTAGQYTKMSLEAKEMIRCFSGLHYKYIHQPTGAPYTDARLMAIDEDPEMRSRFREKLEEELGMQINSDNELMSVPSAENFIDNLTLELNTQQPVLV